MKKKLIIIFLFHANCMGFVHESKEKDVGVFKQTSVKENTSLFNGWYVGAGLGYSSMSIKRDEGYTDTTNSSDSKTYYTNKVNSIAISTSLFLGLQRVFNERLLLGFEALSDFQKKDHDSIIAYDDSIAGNGAAYYSKLLMRDYCILSFKTGLIINKNSSLYLKGGPTYKEYRTQHIYSLSANKTTTLSKSRKKIGWHIGGGLDYAFEKYIIGADLRYDFPITTHTIAPTQFGRLDVKDKFSELTLSLRFSIKL